MTALALVNPLAKFEDLAGNPLQAGFIYIGAANDNPRTAPVDVYWDSAATQLASQPLRTKNGFIARAGTPANLFCPTDYSMEVLDSSGRRVFYAPSAAEISNTSITQNQLVTFIASLAASAGAALVGWIQAGVGAVLRTVQDRLRDEVNVKDFGASGLGVLSDRGAINLAIAQANALGSANRFFGGVTLRFPNGTYYVDGALDPITSSNVVVAGSSHGGSVLYGGSTCNYDILTFDGSALALYNVGAKNLRIYTPGNATVGAHIRATRTINSRFRDLMCMGHYDGIVLDGCGKTMLNGIVFSQENRTSGTSPRYAIDLKGTNFSCSDIHVSDCNAVTDPTNNPNPNVFSVRAVDGLYVANCHGFGSLIVQPAINAAFPSGQTIASMKFTNFYLDQSVNNNVVFSGTSATWRNIQFANCNFRASGGIGVDFNASSPISRIIFTGCDFDGHRLYGMRQLSAVTDLIITGCTFNNNNTDNVANTGDLYISGEATINGNRFIGGGALGTAIQLTASSMDCIVKGNSLVSSTAAKKIDDGGTNNLKSGNTGFTTKKTYTMTVAAGATTGTFNHGLPITPVATDFKIVPGGALHGAVGGYASGTSSSQVTVTVDTAPTGSPATFLAFYDAEHV